MAKYQRCPSVDLWVSKHGERQDKAVEKIPEVKDRDALNSGGNVTPSTFLPLVAAALRVCTIKAPRGPGVRGVRVVEGNSAARSASASAAMNDEKIRRADARREIKTEIQSRNPATPGSSLPLEP